MATGLTKGKLLAVIGDEVCVYTVTDHFAGPGWSGMCVHVSVYLVNNLSLIHI